MMIPNEKKNLVQEIKKGLFNDLCHNTLQLLRKLIKKFPIQIRMKRVTKEAMLV